MSSACSRFRLLSLRVVMAQEVYNDCIKAVARRVLNRVPQMSIVNFGEAIKKKKAAPKRKTFGGFFFSLFLEFAAAPNGWHLKIAIIVGELVFVRIRAKNRSANELPPLRFSNYTNLKNAQQKHLEAWSFWRAAARTMKKSQRENISSENAFASINIFLCRSLLVQWEGEARYVACSIVQCQCLWENCELQLVSLQLRQFHDHASSSGFINSSTLDGLIASQRFLLCDVKNHPVESVRKQRANPIV